MNKGGIRLSALSDGTFGLDGGAMFGIVPKPLWSRLAPCDDANRIKCGTNLLLIETEGRIVLIDCGMGEKWTEKERAIYAIDRPEGGLKDALANLGLTPADVTDVVATHLHFDHQGGATVYDAGGEAVPAFPNARYHYQKRQVEWARSPNKRDRRSFRPMDFEPVLAEGSQAVVRDGAYDLCDGVGVGLSDGHTFGLQTIKVELNGESIFYCSDMLPMLAHCRLPFIMGYDLQPLCTLKEKNEALGAAADCGGWIFLEHDPDWCAAKVRRDGDDFAVADKLTRKEFNEKFRR